MRESAFVSRKLACPRDHILQDKGMVHANGRNAR
jgi:hypothetical protein